MRLRRGPASEPVSPNAVDRVHEDEIPDSLRPKRLHRLYRSPRVLRSVTKHFHRAYYYAMAQTILSTTWMGVRVLKCPFDLWSYQELLVRLRPELVIETGTFEGGSALYLASLMDLIGTGRVLTVDLHEIPNRPQHPRIRYLVGASTAPDVVAAVAAEVASVKTAMVVLDSDHAYTHVLEELHLYSGFVTPGSYLVVEDTNVNGHPVLPRWGPGPMEAVDHFLAERSDFAADPQFGRFLLTTNPRGWLRRADGR